MTKLASCLVPAVLCAAALGQNLAPGDYRESIQFGGRTRTYTVHVPPAARCQRSTPLVMFFHGGGGNGNQAAGSYLLNPIADREGFFAVYADGTAGQPLPLYTWNAGHCCGFAYDNKIDDIGFVRVLVARLRGDYPVDPDRIYATGFSNGGMLSHRIAAELSDIFAAAAPVAGAIGGSMNGVAFNIPRPPRPVPMLIMHGKLDRNVVYEGGPTQEGQIAGRIDKSVAEAAAFWTANNRCAPVPVSRRTGSLVVDSYTGCADGADVEVYTIEDTGHAWAGGLRPVTATGDTPSYNLSASEIIWDFFEKHPRNPRPVAPPLPGAGPSIAAGGVRNAASFKKGSVAPGELLTVFGVNLGPSTLVSYEFAGGVLSRSLAGTEMLVDGIAAPLYYTSSGQVSGFVPYAAAQKACVDIQVSYNGRMSDRFPVPVAPAQPAFFTRDFSGSGPGVIYNQNGTLNTSANPAAPGSIVAMYLTGDGVTTPASIDGKPGELDPTRPTLPVTVFMNGLAAQVVYAGGVKDAIAGVFQVNARVPVPLQASEAASVTVNVGAAATPFGVTLAVR